MLRTPPRVLVIIASHSNDYIPIAHVAEMCPRDLDTCSVGLLDYDSVDDSNDHMSILRDSVEGAEGCQGAWGPS